MENQPIPERLWMFRGTTSGDWVLAVDDPPGGEVFLAALTWPDAVATVHLQLDLYEIECEAVQVLGPPEERSHKCTT